MTTNDTASRYCPTCKCVVHAIFAPGRWFCPDCMTTVTQITPAMQRTTWVALVLGSNARVLLVGKPGEDEATIRNRALRHLDAREWPALFVTTKSQAIRHHLSLWNRYCEEGLTRTSGSRC